MDGGIYDKTDRLLADATAFCILAHAGQFRKNANKEPYCFHPMRVMMWLYRNGERQQEVLAAALLHDVVEDTPHTLSEIREKFGKRVASIVAEVTTDKRLQCFPDDWVICGSLQNQYRQLGNAVPVKFGHAVGRAILTHFVDGACRTIDGFPFSRYSNTSDIEWRQQIQDSSRKRSKRE